jgi:hypothetical protein
METQKFGGNSHGKRPLRRTRLDGKVNSHINLGEIGYEDVTWTELTPDSIQWWAFW